MSIFQKLMKLTAILTPFVLATSMHAAVITGVDLNPNALYTGGGVLDSASRTYEAQTANTTEHPLGSSTMTVIRTGFNLGAFAIPGTPISLYNQYAFFGAGATIEITGLNTLLTYDIVINAGRRAEFGGVAFFAGATLDLTKGTTSGVTTGVTTPTQFETFEENGNFMRFTDITPDSSGAIRFTTSGAGNNFVNGFEIQEIPEPSSAWLSMLILSAAVFSRRRTNV